jgi:hypothetical protein
VSVQGPVTPERGFVVFCTEFYLIFTDVPRVFTDSIESVSTLISREGLKSGRKERCAR